MLYYSNDVTVDIATTPCRWYIQVYKPPVHIVHCDIITMVYAWYMHVYTRITVTVRMHMCVSWRCLPHNNYVTGSGKFFVFHQN